VAEAWGFVKWARGHRPPPAPGLEHLLAEMAAAGRWLADYPVTVAAHDAPLAALFAPAEGSAA
jgi:sugar (pentulose or hexulose) kinase